MANPGHLPWMPGVAARLHELGALAAYCAPVATTADQLQAARDRLPGPLRERVAGELRRRQVPASLNGAQVQSVATAHELVNVVARRLRVPDRAVRYLADWRDAAFDAAVAREVAASLSGVLVAYAAARNTIEAASRMGIRSLLDYPVAHHAFDEALLQEEQRLVPEYAATMQFHQPSEARKRRLTDELTRTDSVLGLSEFHRRTFIESGVPEEKVVAGPLFGVDADSFHPREPFERPHFRVLFAGQITQRKGVSYVVEGFRRAGLAKAELLLLGRPYGGAAPWRAVTGVRHIDMVAPWDTPAHYRSADVFVLPAISDACPRAVLEAMASGIPVIVSENTGTADAVVEGESGYVVPIRDADAIAERLVELHRDPDLRLRMGAAARLGALACTWSAYADGVARLVTGK